MRTGEECCTEPFDRELTAERLSQIATGNALAINFKCVSLKASPAALESNLLSLISALPAILNMQN
jgi:hypothetical protein